MVINQRRRRLWKHNLSFQCKNRNDRLQWDGTIHGIFPS